MKLLKLNSKTLKLIDNKNAGIGLMVRLQAFCGLRYSSIANIKFSDVYREGNNYFITIVANFLMHKNLSAVMIYTDLAYTIKRLYSKNEISEYLSSQSRWVCEVA